MTTQLGRTISLGGLVVAGVVAGMMIAGVGGLTQHASAEHPVVSTAPAQGAIAVDFAALAEQVVPSVVSVYSTDVVEQGESERRMPSDPFEFFFGPRMGPRGQEQREPVVRQSAGSGFFVSTDGELLTNNHVVDGAEKIEIALEDGTRYPVKVVGRDPATDLAVLRVDKADRAFPALSLGSSGAVRVGEWVMAVGNPLNMDHTVTVGVVSGKGRVLGISDSSFENFIQTDAAINFGNSGGPLVNTRGEVVGINTAINAGGQNLGFAVPVDTAKRILPQLRTTGKVVRGYLGAQVKNVDPKTQEAFNLPDRMGAFVESVVPKHAADKAGMKPGDVVVSIDGQKVETTRDLIDLVSTSAPGAEVKVLVLREGKRHTLTVTLEERPSGDEGTEVGDEPSGEGASTRLGLTVSPLDPQTRRVYGVEEELEGVVVTQVKRLSPAGEEGLLRGDVITQANGHEVRSPEDLTEQVKAVEKGGYLRLYVFRPRADQSFFAILKLDE